MSTFRVTKTSDYTVMSNHHLKEKEMSLKSKGLLTLMLSLPDDWDYSLMGLVALCKENETAVRSALEELESFGYLRRDKKYPNQTESGRIEYEYNIYETPIQATKKQGVENLHTEIVHAENPGQSNTIESSTKNQSNIIKDNISTTERPSPHRGLIQSASKSTKTKTWINSKTKILQQFNFSQKVHNEILKFFQVLVESNTLLPDISIQTQLDELWTVPEEKQYTAVHLTVLKGWKSLSYATKEAKELRRPSFDTAKNSTTTIRKEGWQKEYEGQEVY